MNIRAGSVMVACSAALIPADPGNPVDRLVPRAREYALPSLAAFTKTGCADRAILIFVSHFQRRDHAAKAASLSPTNVSPLE